MSMRRTAAAVALLLISLTLAPAASATASREVWQQLTALFARWTGGEIAHGCIPGEVDDCGVEPPQ